MANDKVDEDDGILAFQTDPYVKNLLEQGLSLRQVSTKTEEELSIVQESIVMEHLLQSRNILGLNSLLDDMDLLLSGMEKTLGVYQQDIKRMNQDISIIQLDSKLLDTKVKNRRLAYGLSSELLEGITVSPDLIKKIVDAEINEFYINNLLELDLKLKYVSKHQPEGIMALTTVLPELDRLRLKAVEKIREFFLKKIDSFKAPNTNIALIQQNVFLKYRDLFWFLMNHAQPVGLEIHQNYISHVQAYFLNSFERYYKSLILLQSGTVDKNELIGVDENARRGLFGAIKLSPVKESVNIYGLADRLAVLTSSESGIIVPDHVKDKKFPFEGKFGLTIAIFKSLTRLFIDNASSEYVFTSEFFSDPKNPMPHASLESFFSQTFEPTMKFVETMIKSYIESSFDAIGILFCIRINTQNLRIMQKRRLPILDTFLNLLNILMWPRFQTIMGLHIDSLKKADCKKLLASKDPNVHFIVRRYAEFSASILTLNQGYEEAMLVNSLTRLRTELESLMYKFAAEFPDKKLALAFWINNLDHVQSILNVLQTLIVGTHLFCSGYGKDIL
jgi:vacuolar protein sorting-associated protein 52